MTPETARIVAQLRDWHTRSIATTDRDRYVSLLGEVEAIVGILLDRLDREGAADGHA